VQVEGTTAITAVVSVTVDRVPPGSPSGTGGKLLDGRQVTIGEAPAAWAAAGAR